MKWVKLTDSYGGEVYVNIERIDIMRKGVDEDGRSCTRLNVVIDEDVCYEIPVKETIEQILGIAP
jgi:hypothetical protein